MLPSYNNPIWIVSPEIDSSPPQHIPMRPAAESPAQYYDFADRNYSSLDVASQTPGSACMFFPILFAIAHSPD
jgi:hypothetical protein